MVTDTCNLPVCQASDDIRLSTRLFKRCLNDQRKFCEDVEPGHMRVQVGIEGVGRGRRQEGEGKGGGGSVASVPEGAGSVSGVGLGSGLVAGKRGGREGASENGKRGKGGWEVGGKAGWGARVGGEGPEGGAWRPPNRARKLRCK